MRRLLADLSVDADALAARMAEAIQAPAIPEEPGRLDHAARSVLGSAAAEARAMGSEKVEDVHLLLGILCGPSGPARIALEQANASLLRARIAARDVARDPAEAARRLSEAGLSRNAIQAEAARLMGDGSSKSKLLVVDDVLPGPANRARRAVQRPQLNPWASSARTMRIADLLAATRPSPVFLAILGVLAASAALMIWEPFPGHDRLLIGVFVVAGWLVSLCVHEYGHAAAAFLGGDRETMLRGYLTFDLRRYAHPLLTIAMPLLGLMLGGLPLPGGAVMINRRALRSPRWGLAVSAAGPLGTLVCLLLSAAPFIVGGKWVFYETHPALWVALGGLVMVQASALVLNLLPVPPLDGFNILSYWLSPETKAKGYALGFLPMVALFYLLRQGTPIGVAFWTIVDDIQVGLRLPAGLGDYALWLITAR